MDKDYRELFRRLVREGKTLRAVREALDEAGCDLSGLSQTDLVKNMLCVLRGKPLTWG